LKVVHGEDRHPERPERAVRGLENAERIAGGLIPPAEDQLVEPVTVMRDAGQSAEKIAKRGKGDGLGRLEPDGADDPPGRRRRENLGEEPSLAASRLTGNHRDGRAARLMGLLAEGDQRLQLAAAADEERMHLEAS
jgi:hypothetical protein